MNRRFLDDGRGCLRCRRRPGVAQTIVRHFGGTSPTRLCGPAPFPERYFIPSLLSFQKAADDLFGEETYHAKVDTALPERAQRKWERKEPSGDEG